MEKNKRIWLTIIALIGLLTSVKLIAIFYTANYDDYALGSFCSINEFIDCDGVARTMHSVFLGIPLAVWGVILYLAVLFFAFVDKLKNIKFLGFLEVFKNPVSYIFVIGLFAFLVSMSLFCISVFEIKKLCILCFFTYLLDLVIAIVAAFKAKRADDLLKDCWFDFLEAVKVKKYLIAFIAVMLVAAGFLATTSTTYFMAPHIKKIKEIQEIAKQKTNPYKVGGNILGDEDAKIIVIEFADFQCPGCTIMNTILHKAAKEISGFKVIHKNFPLDTECNKLLRTQMHEGSCVLARYAIAAKKQDKYWTMANEFYEKKPQSEIEILNIAVEKGLDPKKLKEDADSAETETALQNDISYAINQKINSTPQVQIGVKMFPGVTPLAELRAVLIQAGAEDRK